MAKVAKAKKREPTIHSRAHRRNASPPPKELAVKAPSSEETEFRPWLHNAQNAGISKKKKTKQLSRQQKLRQQKAVEKADANLDKLATKVKDSKARGRRVQARRAEWEDLNGKAGEETKKVDEGNREGDEEEQAVQADELDVGMEEVQKASDDHGQTEKLATEAVSLPDPDEDEEL